MKMSTINNKNRTGIYVQESAGVATAGDGLAPQGDKSPVTHKQHTLNIIKSDDDTQNMPHSSGVKNNKSNPFQRSNSQESLQDSLEGDESDRSHYIGFRNCKFRKERYKKMYEEFLTLGFSKQDIKTMHAGLEEARKKRHHENKLKRLCEESKLDAETLRENWIERKERELAKFRAEKEAKIAAGTFNPIPFRERKLQRKKSSEVRKIFNPSHNDIIFTSPAILAGRTEDDSPFSRIGRKRAMEEQQIRMKLGRDVVFEEARRKMGLDGNHRKRRPSNSSYRAPALKELDPKMSNRKAVHKRMVRKALAAVSAKYPFEVQIIDKSHPFGQILFENQSLLLDAIETTVQDERATGGDFIKIGPCDYRKNILYVRCKNTQTEDFLKYRKRFYNRLWPGADLVISREPILFKRHVVSIDLADYNLTSDEFFKAIKKQNGYPTEFWPVYYKREGPRFFMLFGVDPVSYERLEESKGSAYFFFEKIVFNLNGMRKAKS